MSWTAERARVASLTRSRPADDPDLIAAKQRLKAERLAEHVAAVVNAFPPMTDEQLNAVARLLRAGGAAS